MENLFKPAVTYLIAITVTLIVLGLFLHPAKKSVLNYRQMANFIFLVSLATTVYGVYLMKKIRHVNQRLNQLEDKLQAAKNK